MPEPTEKREQWLREVQQIYTSDPNINWSTALSMASQRRNKRDRKYKTIKQRRSNQTGLTLNKSKSLLQMHYKKLIKKYKTKKSKNSAATRVINVTYKTGPKAGKTYQRRISVKK